MNDRLSILEARIEAALLFLRRMDKAAQDRWRVITLRRLEEARAEYWALLDTQAHATEPAPTTETE